MWHIRAKFDIALKAIKPPSQNVFLSCNYCGKNICPAAEEKEKEIEKETKVHRVKDQTTENGSNSFKVCLKQESNFPKMYQLLKLFVQLILLINECKF